MTIPSINLSSKLIILMLLAGLATNVASRSARSFLFYLELPRRTKRALRLHRRRTPTERWSTNRLMRLSRSTMNSTLSTTRLATISSLIWLSKNSLQCTSGEEWASQAASPGPLCKVQPQIKRAVSPKMAMGPLSREYQRLDSWTMLFLQSSTSITLRPLTSSSLMLRIKVDVVLAGPSQE